LLDKTHRETKTPKEYIMNENEGEFDVAFDRNNNRAHLILAKSEKTKK